MVKTRSGVLFLSAVLLLGCTPSSPRLASVSIDRGQQTRLLIREVSVFDGRVMLRNQDVLIEGEDISAIGTTGTLGIAGSIAEIAGSGRTLLPGLVDSHAHLFSAGQRGGVPPSADAIAQAFLFAGVTTILVAAGGDEVQDLNDRREEGQTLTPHLHHAGPGLTAPDGHPIPLLQSMLPWPMSWLMVRSIPVAASAQDAEIQVSKIVDDVSPEFVKIIFDDLPPGSPHLSEEALDGAIQAAWKRGVRPVVHASSSADAIAAAEKGAALLMHIPQQDVLTDVQIRRLAATKVPVVTTVRLISASRELSRRGAIPIEAATIAPDMLQDWIDNPEWDLEGFSEEVDHNNALATQNTETNFKKLLAAGVPLLVGTDSGVHGVFPGASIHSEIQTLVRLGMEPIAALRAATSTPARFLDPEGTFGRIIPGQRADLLLVVGDPSVEIETLSKVEAVFLSGRRLLRTAIN